MSKPILVSNTKLNAYKTAIATLVVSVFAAYHLGSQSKLNHTPDQLSPLPTKQTAELLSKKTSKISEVEVVDQLKSIVPGIPITTENIIYHERVGMYQFMLKDTVFYMTDTGSALIKGDVFDSAMMNYDPDRGNLTQQFSRALSFARNELDGNNTAELDDFTAPSNPSDVIDMMNKIPDEGMITYPSETPTKDVIFVFFDIDCPVCKKFMPEVSDLQKMGYEVKLVLVHKLGRMSPAFKYTKAMLCQSNPNSELKLYLARGYSGFSRKCEVNLDHNHAAFTALGVRGTPSMVRKSDGVIFKGLHYASELASK